MRIAILGSGAMGSLFGSYLSQNNYVWLIDNDENKVKRINEYGVTISENGSKKLSGLRQSPIPLALG